MKRYRGPNHQNHFAPMDFLTYREIMDKLLVPIEAQGLDDDTLKRLYESKLVYLENLRDKCFWEINQNEDSHFSMDDYELILEAIRNTRRHLKHLILLAITTNLSRGQRNGRRKNRA